MGGRFVSPSNLSIFPIRRRGLTLPLRAGAVSRHVVGSKALDLVVWVDAAGSLHSLLVRIKAKSASSMPLCVVARLHWMTHTKARMGKMYLEALAPRKLKIAV